jgi:hypothetical protein
VEKLSRKSQTFPAKVKRIVIGVNLQALGSGKPEKGEAGHGETDLHCLTSINHRLVHYRSSRNQVNPRVKDPRDKASKDKSLENQTFLNVIEIQFQIYINLFES